jgi:Peptidase S46
MRSVINIFASLILLVSIASSSLALAPDEGMYMPDQIARLPLAARGLKIRTTDIFNPNGGGLSEAVVRLSVGCTSEFISPDGLLLTNHHCGFDALVSASTPEKNYAEIGYKAASRAEELPGKDYSIFITEREVDVTTAITKGTENLSGDALTQAIKKNTDDMQKAEQDKAPKGSTIRIQSMNNGLFYYLFQTKQIKDIRVVYAPQRNIGVFGGDPDNFEWTRHTGDFTFLRAYVAPDGSSADYSPANVPYKPKKYLTINLDGAKENDFVFVLGYPGGTTRYRESQSIAYSQDVNFPFLFDYLTAWSSALREVGRDDEAKRVALQGELANIDNGLKLYEGGKAVLRRSNIATDRQDQEKKFAAWVNSSPARQKKYGAVLPGFTTLYTNYYSTSARDRVLRTFPNPNTMPVFKQILDAVQAMQQGKALDDKKRGEISEAFKVREPVLERELIKYMLNAIDHLPNEQRFSTYDTIFARFQGKARRSAEETFAESIAEKDFTTPESIYQLYTMKPAQFREKYQNIYDFMTALAAEQTAITARLQKFNNESSPLRMLYAEGMSEMKGVKPYPDANSTLRFTFGNIKGYSPREAVTYSPFTTLKGVIQKDTGAEPFDVPAGLVNLQRTKDFGRYGSGDTVPVNFLATTDIIGGNSGSPVLNGFGDQIGLVFDGNYEGLGNDIFYSPDYGRTIAVDIRYVLFITDKFAGESWILKEMKIKGGRGQGARIEPSTERKKWK